MYALVTDTSAAAAKTLFPTMYRNSYPQNATTDPLNTFTQINYAQVGGFPTNGYAVFPPGTYSSTIPFGGDVTVILPPWLILPANVVGPPAVTANRMSFLVMDGPLGTSVNGYPYQWLQMTDTLVAGAAITAPAANGQVPTGTTFTWAPVTGATGYAAQLATDSKFQGLVGLTTAITGLNQLATIGATVPPTPNPNFATGATSINVPTGTLNPGTTYYFRVQVVAPLTSKFSAPVTFSALLAQLGSQLNVPGQYGPVAGAINVPIKPVFQWAGVQGAQSYDLQVADNPVFVNPLDAQTGLNTNVWTETKPLSPNSVYYWRVRAVAANGTSSDWVAGSFTTSGPVSTAPATTTQAPPQPPVTITQTQAPVTITQTPPAKFFDQNSGLYFNTQNELSAYQAAHPANQTTNPATPSYIWVIIVIGAILVIAVIVLIVRTRKV
jgi:hypothetical protein